MKSRKHSLEILEARIAPAAASSSPLLPPDSDTAAFVQAIPGTPAIVHAGQVLEAGGKYLMYVQAGEAMVFFTDLNNNGKVDFNEVTGIAAGNGLSLISFVDIHGDIVTNLREQTVSFPGTLVTAPKLTLSDSDNNASNDDPQLGGDGRVLLNNSIAKIELRTIHTTDIGDISGPSTGVPDGTVDQYDVAFHQAPTTCSIFGNIYVGGNFGTADGKGGLIIDPTNAPNFGFAVLPEIGSIKTGTAVSGQFFSFGASAGNSSGVSPVLDDSGHQVTDSKGRPAYEQDNPAVSGLMTTFVPPKGQPGGFINGLHVLDESASSTTTTGTGGTGTGGTTPPPASLFTLNLDTLQTGKGGIGAAGGNIVNISIPKDDSGGYQIIAGDGGQGPSGGNGGTISNFADLGSTTGYIFIHSGSGGTGVTGAGGNGGDVVFGTFTPRANVHLELGSGGNGFTVGGNGSSLLSGTFAQVNAGSVPVQALTGAGETHVSTIVDPVTGATHYVATIGTNTGGTAVVNQQAVDFNNDGVGDYAYTTGGSNSQLIVMFGDGQGGFEKFDAASHDLGPNQIFLSGARNATAMVVADLNGDGHPDIAVASSDTGSQEGVVVYLSKYVAGKFVGFEAPRYSVLPQLETGRPGSQTNEFLGAVDAPQQITQLVAGDFNGDGHVELAAQVTEYGLPTTDQYGTVTSFGLTKTAIIFLQPAFQNDYLHKLPGGGPTSFPTGQFYADFGYTGQGSNLAPIDRDPVFYKAAGKMEASALSTASSAQGASTHDVLFLGAAGAKAVSVYDYGAGARDGGVTPTAIGKYALGIYDDTRDPKNIGHAAVALTDYTVLDYNGDGLADLGVLSNQSGGLLVAVKGDGTGAGTNDSGGAGAPTLNAGNLFGPLGFKVKNPGAFMEIKSGDFHSGAGVAVLDGEGGSGVRVETLFLRSGVEAAGTGAQLDPVPELILPSPPSGPNVAQTTGFGLHYQDVTNPDSATPGASWLDGTTAIEFQGSVQNPLGFEGAFNYNTVALSIHAGDGGSSLIGHGGNGGSIGSGKIALQTGTTANTGTAALTINGQLNLTLAGDLFLTAGNGGDGFSSGGNGGAITGVNMLYRGGVDVGLGFEAISGHGGRGVSGAGGTGGNIAYNYFQTSLRQGNLTPTSLAFESFLTAGDGGQGNVGGVGGAIIGNGTKAPDVTAIVVVAQTGHGGSGMRAGGAGGSITNFHPNMAQPGQLTGSFTGEGELLYVAGAGGTTVSGAGGAGGSILNSSPVAGAFIEGTLEATAGDGGSGGAGGAGGSVSNLVLVLPASQGPKQVTIVAGIGGNGTGGAGGAGGSITNIQAQSNGGGDPFSPLSQGAFGVAPFNRIIAGDGGSSSGNVGGAGGTVSLVKSGSSAGAFALIAGAGGDGLIAGGAGGSVLTSQLDIGGKAVNKGLVIAGAGGNAFAFVPNADVVKSGPAAPGVPADTTPNQAQNAFGGRVGKGGNGGSISAFTQSGQNKAHVDLIAGNGGSTQNYGTIFDNVSYVGNGGSVTNVAILGDIGNNDPTVPIKSYNDTSAGQTIAQFVDSELRNGSVSLDDALGNVGIVVGVAGSNKGVIDHPVLKPQVKTFIPSPKSVNGSLINISFHSLLSAVADSVDHIAAIQLVANLQNVGGSLGSAKNPPPGIDPTTFEGYIGADGAPSSVPQVGGALIDGAIVGKQFRDASGRIFVPQGTGTREYQPT